MTRLLVRYPASYEPERRYAIDVVLGTLLGLDHRAEPHDGAATVIALEGAGDGRKVTVADGLFALPESEWLEPASLPAGPLPRWRVTDDVPEALTAGEDLPVLFGARQGPWLTQDEHGLRLGVDVFGTALFMLARYEELVATERDRHGRFPAAASLAAREGFLERPVVDEHAEALWACLRRLWPGLERRPRRPRLLVSHDVDWPLSPRDGLAATLRSAVGAAVRTGPAAAAAHLRAYAARVARRPDLDPYDTFDMIMDATESLGARSAFYFIAGRTAGRLDGDHDLRDPWVMGLVRRVAERGHEVGLHPSYGSFRDPAQVRRELERLLAAADELGVEQDEWGGRQHFLRWEAPTTWRAWADAGLAYDSSLGYADRVGFRSGTCHEHEVFDLRARRRLPLRERPLVVMEATLLERKYMGLGHEAAVETARRLRATCERFGGDFTLLWHNSYLLTAADRQAFRRVIA